MDTSSWLRCELCHKPKRVVHRHAKTGQLACTACYRAHLSPRHICGYCGKLEIAEYNEPKRGPVCQPCYRKHIQVGQCFFCQQQKRIVYRRGQSRPACAKCYRSKVHLGTCARCHRRRPIYRRLSSGDVVCEQCCGKRPKRGVCPGCQKVRYIFRTLPDGRIGCQRCYELRTRGRCRTCHQQKPIRCAGQCVYCYGQSRRKPCAYCGHTRAVYTRTTDGKPACQGCWKRRHPKPCACCGKMRPLQGYGLCAGCTKGRGRLFKRFPSGTSVRLGSRSGIVSHEWFAPERTAQLRLLRTHVLVRVTGSLLYWPIAEITV